MRVALVSDVHVHRHDQADEVAALVDHIHRLSDVDLLLCAGDLSHRTPEIERFLAAIRLDVPCAWVPGNHDIWVIEAESGSDTAAHRYHTLFPELSRRLGWHYLPAAPLLLPKHHLAVVGTIGWFTGPGPSEWFDTDASDADDALARSLAADLDAQLHSIPAGCRAIALTHHVPDARCLPAEGNRLAKTSDYLTATLQRHALQLALVAHGHKHRRYGPLMLDGVPYVAHPFGYPTQHTGPEDGVRVLDVAV